MPQNNYCLKGYFKNSLYDFEWIHVPSDVICMYEMGI